MLLFGTGILLYLAVGAVAAPSQAGPKDDTTDNEAAAVESPPIEATTAESTAGSSATGNSTSASSGDPTSAGPSSEVTSAGASSVATSAGPTSTTGVDLKSLFGEEQRPDITHLAAVEKGINDKNNETLTSISTVLLALTKLQSEGEWIKSLFDLPGDKGSVTEGPDVVNITLWSVPSSNFFSNLSQGTQKSMRIDRGNMKMLAEVGVESSLIKDTEPWWPWALIEGVLEIESTYTEDPRKAFELADGQEADYWLRLKIMTANAKTVIRPYDVDPAQETVSNALESADISPVLLELDINSWAVMMRAPHKNATSDNTQIGWAKPFPPKDNHNTTEFNSYMPLNDVKSSIIGMVYVNPPRAFTGRPEKLQL